VENFAKGLSVFMDSLEITDGLGTAVTKGTQVSQGTVTLSYVANKQRAFSHNGKDFIDYGVKIGTDEWYSFVQFADADAPQTGDVIENVEIIPKEKYNDQIRGKLVRQVVNSGAPASQNGAAPQSTYSGDDRQVSIVRQHSQEMAIRWLAIQPKASAYTLDDLRGVIAWFEADAWGDSPDAPTAIERTEPEGVSGNPDDDIPF